MFSMCSELTPRARIPDTRIPQFMQPWMCVYKSRCVYMCLPVCHKKCQYIYVRVCVCLCYSVFECFRVFYACFSFFLCVNAWEHCLLMAWVEGNKLRVLTTIYNDLNVLRVGHLLLHSGSLPCWTMLFSCLLGSAWFNCAICSWEDLNVLQMER